MAALERWVIRRRARHWFEHNDLRYEFFEFLASLLGREEIDEEEFPPRRGDGPDYDPSIPSSN